MSDDTIETEGESGTWFSRICQAKFSRFTLDRLMAILARLGQDVELSVSVRPRAASPLGETALPVP